MNAKQFKSLLIKLDTCCDAVKWAKGKTLTDAWNECERADWMCWLLVKMANKPGWPNNSIVMHCGVDCAETALHYTNDVRVNECLTIARKHADGKATDEELDAARATSRAAAWAAAWAASRVTAMVVAGSESRNEARIAALAAAWAALRDAASAAYRDAYRDAASAAARAAAWAAAWAASRVAAGSESGAAAWTAAWTAALKNMADIIRKRIPTPYKQEN
jgi:hypothetical protein